MLGGIGRQNPLAIWQNSHALMLCLPRVLGGRGRGVPGVLGRLRRQNPQALGQNPPAQRLCRHTVTHTAHMRNESCAATCMCRSAGTARTQACNEMLVRRTSKGQPTPEIVYICVHIYIMPAMTPLHSWQLKASDTFTANNADAVWPRQSDALTSWGHHSHLQTSDGTWHGYHAALEKKVKSKKWVSM